MERMIVWSNILHILGHVFEVISSEGGLCLRHCDIWMQTSQQQETL